MRITHIRGSRYLPLHAIFADIDAVKRQYSYIPEKDFDAILNLDPTFDSSKNSVGKYGKWLLGLYKKDNPLEYESGYIVPIIKKYDELKNDRKYQIEKDINKFKSLEDMAVATEDAQETELSKRQKERELRTSKDYKEVYKDEDWTIYMPLSYAGSCTLGKGTNWCTSYSDDDSYYEEYTEKGPLYVLINNENPREKYQFHFETDSYMDDNDNPINLIEFCNKYPKISEFFKLDFSPIEDYVYSYDTVVSNRDKNRIVSLIIDESVDEIPDNEFEGYGQLESVYIEIDDMYAIRSEAFMDCVKLKSINMPNQLEKLGRNVFRNCISLKSIEIPYPIKNIGTNAFWGCAALDTVDIPDSVEIIEMGAFQFCKLLRSITIPSSVRRIGPWAFDGCTSLQTVFTNKGSVAEAYFKRKYPEVNIEYIDNLVTM